jgi:hypothetical protein
MYGGTFDVISTFNSTTWPSGELSKLIGNHIGNAFLIFIRSITSSVKSFPLSTQALGPAVSMPQIPVTVAK